MTLSTADVWCKRYLVTRDAVHFWIFCSSVGGQLMTPREYVKTETAQVFTVLTRFPSASLLLRNKVRRLVKIAIRCFVLEWVINLHC
jgi:hypothetical protein